MSMKAHELEQKLIRGLASGEASSTLVMVVIDLIVEVEALREAVASTPEARAHYARGIAQRIC